MKRMIDIALLCLVPALCFGAASVRDVDLTFDTANDADLLVSHKASSGLKIDGTVTNSQDSALVDISGSTVTCGFKTDVTATNFLVFATGSLVDSGTGGQFTVTLPAAQWVTNISRKIRYYGDVRISGLGNPLPSIELWLYPSANTGDETTYVAPSDASWQTNGVDVGDVTTVNFASGITAANTNGTLTVSASTAGEANATIAGDGITATTNGTDTTVAVDSTVFRADGSVAMTGDLNFGGQDATNIASLQFSGGTGTQGTMSWNTDEETVDLICDGAVLQVGQELYYQVRNSTGTTITNGQCVYASGTVGASGRITAAPYLADGNTDAMLILGVATVDIADGADGKVTAFGKVRAIDTSTFNEGDVLYPSATVAGGFVTTAPTGSNVATPVAFVITKSATVGVIAVRVHPTDENDLTRTVANYLPLAGGTMTGDLNMGGQAVTNKVSDQFTSTTNSLTTEFYSASNRWAHVEVYGSTTNIIFITPER